MLALYFFAFGLQFVLYPAIATFALAQGGAAVGAAQMALTAPMFCLLLFGGLLAERAQTGPTLAGLQIAFAVPPIALALLVASDNLTFPMLLAYGVVMGSLAAFMQPVRDAALNGIVDRAAAAGRSITLAQAATAATAVQIGAQIVGILAARFADRHGPAPLLVAQAAAVAGAAWLAIRLRAPRPIKRPRQPAQAIREIHEGLGYAFTHPIIGSMLWSSAYVGIFIVGAFQVLFPLLIRELYGGGAAELGALYACFWGASFVAAIILGRMRPLRRPGRALLICHLLGAAVFATLAIDKPLWAFAVSTMLVGGGAGVAIAMSRTITQACAEPAFLGRVIAVYSMGFMGGAPIGSALVGLGYDVFRALGLGAGAVALIPAIGLGASALALAALTPIWRLENDRPD
jgi:MFS family permease